MNVISGLWVLSVDLLTLFYLVFVLLQTVPVVYKKYEDKMDDFGEKAFKKQYGVFNEKVLSKIPKGFSIVQCGFTYSASDLLLHQGLNNLTFLSSNRSIFYKRCVVYMCYTFHTMFFLSKCIKRINVQCQNQNFPYKVLHAKSSRNLKFIILFNVQCQNASNTIFSSLF
ncbi:uncharacterized protein LOC124940644 isoform X2 [Impatiens glandulifera]|uniref:uncharacterized protein LOC124940644 isoform X2 n=1 Tax=Impatiens glandulifera TaxID=253017 RepID=UPI001FB0859C|nr:uncharacterized protein LOC124940644 isoform X2 [Impatiens glandulifera]